MGFDGFNQGQIRKLSLALVNAGATASALRSTIGGIIAEAEAAASKAGVPLSPPGAEADGGTLLAVSRSAPPMAKDITTRLNDLLAWQAAKLPAVSPGAFFTLQVPPDPAKVKAAIAYLGQQLGLSDLVQNPGQGADNIYTDWKKLNPTELDAVIRSLSPAELGQLNKAIGISATDTEATDAPTENFQADFASMIFSEVGKDTLAKVGKYLPALQPDLQADNMSGMRYQTVPGQPPLFAPGGVNAGDLAQSLSGADSGLIAALGSVVMKDPGFLAQHVRENANGTYTVTFYANGKPQNVTVDGSLPYGTYSHDPNDPNTTWTGFQGASSGTNPDTGNPSSLWAGVYEKAYAQFKGGYGALGSVNAAQAMTDVTGKQASTGSPGDYSLSQVAGTMRQGGTVTARAKNGDQNAWQSFVGSIRGDAPKFMGTGGSAVANNQDYVVKSVNSDGHPPTITLTAPWGGGADSVQTGVDKEYVGQGTGSILGIKYPVNEYVDVPEYTNLQPTVTLTEQQWQQYFGSVSSVNLKQ